LAPTEGRFASRTVAGARGDGSATDLAFRDFVMDAPWQVADVSRLLARLTISLLALLVTWYGAAHTTHVNRQFVWIAVGAAGAAIGVVAVVAWETAGLARVRYLKLEVAAAIRAGRGGSQTAARANDVSRQNGTASTTQWVSAPGMRLYHRPGCQLVLGKISVAVSQATIDRRGLTACGVCGAS
jgi:hypothetical protein